MAKRILLVHDSDDLRSFLIIMLKSYSYETIEAVTGKEAVDKAISGTPDLILIDISLPDITRVDAAKTIKANPITANIPIIAYTALPARKWKQAAINAVLIGCSTQLERPKEQDANRGKQNEEQRPPSVPTFTYRPGAGLMIEGR